MSFYFPLWTKCVNTKELAELFWENLILRAPSAGGERWQISRELKNEQCRYYHDFAIYIELNLLLDSQAIKPNALVYKLASFSAKD